MANGPVPNILGAVQQGLGARQQFEQLGAARDLKKQQKLAAQQQEMLGGLRRTSLGLGGSTPEQQEEARLELLSAHPVAAGKFFDNFSKLPTPEQDKLRLQNERIGTAASSLLQFDDAQLAPAINQTAAAFANSGDQQSAERAMQLAELAKTDPAGARQRLIALEGQSRDQEDIITSREKKAKRLADQSQTDIDTDLKKSKNQFDQIDKLRSRVDTASKEFNKVRDANNRVEAIFDTNKQAQEAAKFAEKVRANPKAIKDITDSTEAFGDMALIFNFMKMLDPGSTVREGEFATAANTGGADEKIINFYNNALKGTRLTVEQRAGLRKQATGLFNKAKTQNDKDTAKFRKSAEAFDLPMDQIFDQPEQQPTTGVAALQSFQGLAPEVQERVLGLEGIEDLSPEQQERLILLETTNVGG